jgi:hypothetical protein
MKRYLIIGGMFFLIFIICFAIGVYLYRINQIPKDNSGEGIEISDIKVTDECINEAKDLLVQANSRENKISPNAILILKKHYKECNHTTKDYVEIPKELVNLTKEQLEQIYKEWTIESFSPNEIVLKREEKGICNEHYVLREVDGVIGIYYVDRNNIETLKEKTGISIKYLPETDRINLRNGIRINGKEALNSILEDFE